MTTELIFGVDLDGVTANYNAGFTAVAEQEFGLKPGDLPIPNSWNFKNWYDVYPDFDFFPLHEKAVVEHHMFRTLPVMDGAVEALHSLAEAGVTIRIITHRFGPSSESHALIAADTTAWLDEHDIPYSDICFLKRKADVACDIYIDDAPHNIDALHDAEKLVIIYDQLYNRDVSGGFRATNWTQVERYVMMAQATKRKSGIGSQAFKGTE